MVVRAVLSLAIGGYLFWLLSKGGMAFMPPDDAWARYDWWGVAGFVLLWLVGTFLRSYRWVHLLRPIEPNVSTVRALAVSLLGYAALFAPMRMGELVRPTMIARDRQVGFVQAAGTVVAERIVDGVVLTVILALALWSSTPVEPPLERVGDLVLPVKLVPGIAMASLALFLGAFLAMVLFYFWRALAHRVVFAVVGVVSKPLAELVTRQVDRISDSLSFLLSRKHGVAFVRDTLLYWAVSAVSFMLLLRSAGAPATLAQACVTIGVLGLGTALPGPPGFYGTYQLACYCGIAMFYPDRVLSSGVMFTFIGYCTQLAIAVLCLGAGLWLLARTQQPVVVAKPLAQPGSGGLVSESSR
ncbi:MAG: lysylphosphatidylglycerol synthase transmembrane domain-containing protein [Polyangiales bacterium]